jgi:hypothetical protein
MPRPQLVDNSIARRYWITVKNNGGFKRTKTINKLYDPIDHHIIYLPNTVFR